QRRQVEAWVVEAIQKRPDAVLLASKLGVIQIRLGRFDEAERVLRRLLAGHPDNTDVLNNLAWLLALREPARATEALELINHAIDVAGAVPSLVDTRSVVQIRAGQLDQAIVELDRARAMDPRNPSLALHLAWAYQGQGRLDEARKAFQQARDL